MSVSSQHDARLDIAVIGMAGRFPDAPSVDELWRGVRDGWSGVRRFTPDELVAAGVPHEAMRDPLFVPAAPLLRDHPGLFDAEFFGFSPREAELLDPQHRLFLECAWEALENAGYGPACCPPAVGVYASASMSAYLLFNLMSRPDLVHPAEAAQTMFCNDKDFVSTRVSYELNLRGPSVTVQTACSSSLVAIHTACQALLTHECDLAIAGGVSVHVPQRTGYYYIEGGYHTPDGCCRPFDARAQGTLFGSGAGVVALKRLADALAARDTIAAVVRGSAINNDGAGKVGFTAPSVDGQADTIARAYAIADVPPGSIGFVETHGTATSLGDAVEIAALRKIYADVPERRRCALGSIKANIGHLDVAAGVTGFIKAVLTVRDGVIPPMAHFEQANAALGLDDSPFYVPTSSAGWPESLRPRRAAVSSFGIGGTNCHVVVEEAPALEADRAPETAEIIAISARTASALECATVRLADHLADHADIALSSASYTLLAGRDAFRHRRFCVCRDRPHAIASLLDPTAMTTCVAAALERPAAFLFPGGGAQYATMGAGTYAREPVFREAVDRCAALLVPTLGRDLRRIIHPSASDAASAGALLTRAAFALPALLTVEYGLARLWMSWGVSPRAMLGHSLGEYAAAVISGAMALSDALELVALRGALIERLPEGAMVSVAATPDAVAALLDDCELAAVNAPAQCVVTGPAAAIARFTDRLTAHGIENRRIPIQAAGHSSLVDAVLDDFGERLARVALHAPDIPYVSCITGDWIRADQARDPEYWVAHFRRPIRFADAITCIADERPQTLLEVGPGRTLGSLVRANCGTATASADLAVVPTWPHAHDADQDVPTVLAAAAKIWALGGSVAWDRLFEGRRPRRVPLPTYPFERQRFWIEPAPPQAHAVSARGKTPNVDDWLHRPTWREDERVREGEGRAIRSCLLFAGDAGLAGPVANALERHGARVTTIDGSSPAAARVDELRRLIASLRDAGACPDAAIHLSTCGGATLELVHERGVDALLALAKAFEAECSGRSLLIQVASDRMFDVTGAEEVLPEKAILAAPCLVIPQEFPHQRCQIVDVGPARHHYTASHVAERLVDELVGGLVDPKIALRSRHRWVEHFAPMRPEGRGELLADGGTYVIAGCGRVGARIGRHLAARSGVRIAIVSRSGAAWPDPALAGADITTFRGDLRDAGRMREIADALVARFGCVDGIVHAAGESGAKTVRLIADLDARTCAAEVRARADTLAAIADLVERMRAAFCLVVSSNATWLGGLGSVAYTAGHQFGDSFVAARARAGDTQWIATDWDGWPAADGSAGVGPVRTTLDQYVMTPDECGLALDRVLTPRAPARVIVSTGDVAARRRQWVTFDAPTPSPAAVPADATGATAPPQTDHERAIVAVWQEVLGVSAIGVTDNFFDLGGNSLMALKIVSRLTRLTDRAVALTSMFEAPTPRALAALLHGAAEQAPDVQGGRLRGERRRQRNAAPVPAEAAPQA